MSLAELKTKIKASNFNRSFSSFQSYVDIAYASLVALLGKPNADADGYKVDAIWEISFEGKNFTIYNYKDGKNYRGSEGVAVEDIREWHIGGWDRKEAQELSSLLQSTPE
jgi:hypothetical protein